MQKKYGGNSNSFVTRDESNVISGDFWTQLVKLYHEVKVRSDEYFNFSCTIAHALLQELSVPWPVLFCHVSSCFGSRSLKYPKVSKSFLWTCSPRSMISAMRKVEPFHLKATDFLSPALLPVPTPSDSKSKEADGDLKCLRWNSTTKDALTLGRDRHDTDVLMAAVRIWELDHF